MGMKYYADPDSAREYPNGSRVLYTHGPFKSVAKVENCPCEDGKRRSVFATAEPDTFFSIPACVYVYDRANKVTKTVGGYLKCDGGNFLDGWEFIAVLTSRNASLLKDKAGPNAQE